MIALACLAVTLGAMAMVLVYVLGLGRGGQYWIVEAQRVRADAAAANRQLHDLTRSAFVALAEEAERRRDPNQ